MRWCRERQPPRGYPQQGYNSDVYDGPDRWRQPWHEQRGAGCMMGDAAQGSRAGEYLGDGYDKYGGGGFDGYGNAPLPGPPSGLYGPPHAHPEAQHREPRRRGWTDSLCSAASTGTLLAAVVFFLLVVPQRTGTMTTSLQGHGRKVADVLSSVHERYTGAAAAAAADARALEEQTHAVIDHVPMSPSPDPEPASSAELSKERSAGWQLDEESGAWVQREEEPPSYQRPDPERIALGEEGRVEEGQAGERVQGEATREEVLDPEGSKTGGGGEGIVPVHVYAAGGGQHGDGKLSLEILAKEGVSWVADGVLRENSYGDYREALLPPYRDSLQTDRGVFEEAHGANLLVLPSGEIMCAWFSGNEGKNGVAVVLSRLHPGAMEWTAPAIVEGGYEFGYALQNPVLYYTERTNELTLVLTAQDAAQYTIEDQIPTTLMERRRGARNGGLQIAGRDRTMVRREPPPSVEQQFRSRNTHYSWDQDMNVLLSSQSTLKKRRKDRRDAEYASKHDGYRGAMRSEGVKELIGRDWDKTLSVSDTRMATAQVRMLTAEYKPMVGLTWSQAVTLEAFGNGSFVRNQAIRGANNNEWLLPVYFAREGIGASNKQRNSQYSALARRYDDSTHWEFFNMSSPGQALVQPTVVRLLDGTLKAWFRDRDAGFIFTSESNDDGHAWTRPIRTVLPNNNKAIQSCEIRASGSSFDPETVEEALALMLASGNILMVFNNNAGTKNARDGKMWPMSVAMSIDQGRMWTVVRDLEEDFDPFLEYSSPSVVQSADGWVHIAYTWSYKHQKRKCIRYVSFTEKWLLRKRWQRGHTQGMFLGGEYSPHQLFPETKPDSPMNSLLNLLNQEAPLNPTLDPKYRY